MVQPIPKPEILDANRPIHRDRGNSVEQALSESCAYANMLWDDLDSVRRYLLDSLPPDPSTPGAHPGMSASPTDPTDDVGWQRWKDTFASVTSVLCGPHGDSGFGVERANEEEHRRRVLPSLIAMKQSSTDHAATPRTRHSESPAAAHSHQPDGRHPTTSWTPTRVVTAAALGVLVLRGLRPRRRSAE